MEQKLTDLFAKFWDSSHSGGDVILKVPTGAGKARPIAACTFVPRSLLSQPRGIATFQALVLSGEKLVVA